MSKKLLKNIGAIILTIWIIVYMFFPALTPIQDPSFEQMKDMQKFQFERRIERAERERNIAGIMGLFLGIGITFLAMKIIKKESPNKSVSL
jgi:hypothetical protein